MRAKWSYLYFDGEECMHAYQVESSNLHLPSAQQKDIVNGVEPW